MTLVSNERQSPRRTMCSWTRSARSDDRQGRRGIVMKSNVVETGAAGPRRAEVDKDGQCSGTNNEAPKDCESLEAREANRTAER